MSETHTVYDPFLGRDVQVSARLVDRLRGRYASGPTMENGEPEFGWREFETPPIQHQAAARIEKLEAALRFYTDADNYNQRGWQGDPDPAPVMSDRGQRARDALNQEG